MKIVFVIEYFFPFDKGGSEWSTFYLAKGLVKSGHKVTILTPDYGSDRQQTIEGVQILRYPFYKKVKNFETIPSNFFFTNPFFVTMNRESLNSFIEIMFVIVSSFKSRRLIKAFPLLYLSASGIS